MHKFYPRLYPVKQQVFSLLLIIACAFSTKASAQASISVFLPTSAPTDSVVTITGTGFTNVDAVLFGNTPAMTFTVVSATTILATVNKGASGSVSVVAGRDTVSGVVNADTVSLAGFTYIVTPAPTITSFSPTYVATPDTAVIITGTNFTGATGVSFGGTPAASFTVLSPTKISAVPNFGSPGYVSVTTWGGTASMAGFYYAVSPPVITSFSPTSGSVDSVIYISGTNLTTVNQVGFGGTPAASFTVLSPTSIVAYVGIGSSGSVSVRNDTGTASLGGFVYISAAIAPTVTSFTPTSAATDSTVMITGTNFTGVTAVSFGGAPALSFTVVSPTTISAVVGYGLSGSVSVQNTKGVGSLGGFTCTTPPVPPTITGFNPTSAATGTAVTITGTNFLGVSGVSFGGTPALSFTILSSTAISAMVGYGASGDVSMRNDTGTAALAGFVYLPAAGVPSITSFTPSTAYTDSMVTITGFNFTGATSVLFGGTPAASFTVASQTEIQAVVGTGSSGAVTVVTPGPGDTAVMGGFYFAQPPPPSFAVLQFTGVLANDQAQLQWQVGVKEPSPAT